MRLSEPIHHLPHHIVLTSFPLDNHFVNPGIGVQMYDFLVPLQGQEHYGIKKDISETAGTLPEDKPSPNLKTETTFTPDLIQEGFGHPSSSSTSAATDTKKSEKLGLVFQAMQNAKIKTEKLTYVPKKQKSIGKKLKSQNKFKLV